MHVCAIYGLRTVCPNIGVMLSNENAPVWINHVFHVIYLVSSPRIMCGPVVSFVTVKIIVHVVRRLQSRSIATRSGKSGRSRCILARFSDLLNNLTVYSPAFPINQASVYWIALQPVVYVAFDEDLFAKLFSQRELYGVVVCFVEWRSCRNWYIHFRVYWPVFFLGVIAFELSLKCL